MTSPRGAIPIRRLRRTLVITTVLLTSGCGSNAGMDSAASTDLVTSVLTPTGAAPTADQLDTAATILRQRIALVDPDGASTLEVADGHLEAHASPVVSDALAEIGAVGRFEIRPVLGAGSAAPGTLPLSGVPYTADDYLNLDCTSVTSDATTLGSATEEIVACAKDGTGKFHLGVARLAADDVADAEFSTVTSGQAAVVVTLTSAGTEKFSTLSQEASAESPPKNQVALVIDGVVFSAPTVAAPIITTGMLQISGFGTERDGMILAAVLAYGALPLSFTISTAAAG